MKRWLNRNVLTLSWVSFLQDAASEMLYPIMPVLLTSVLHAPAAVVGAIEGAAEGVAALIKLASNRINHYVPRKMMVLLGYGAAAVGKVFVAAATVWPIVLTGRLIDRVGKGLRSAPRDSMLLHGSERIHRGKVIGFHRTADTLGAVLGPVLALSLLAIFNNDIRSVLWFVTIPAALSVMAVLFVKDGQRSQRAEARMAAKASADGKLDSSSLLVVTDPPGVGEKFSSKLRLVLGLIAGFSVVNFPDALVLLHVSQVGFSLSGVVGAYLLYNICYAALNFPLGWLADRLAPNKIYAIGLVFFGVTYSGMSLTRDPQLTLFLLALYGGFAAANDTVGKSWVSKLAPESKQLWAQSVLQGSSGFGVLAAGLWAGGLWTLGAGAGTVPLLVAGTIALVIAVIMALLPRDSQVPATD
jgi:MFS family permease